MPATPAWARVTRETAPVRLSGRTYDERITGGPNAHAAWYKVCNHREGPLLGPLRIMIHYVVIESLKHCPSLALKRVLLRCLGMRLARGVTIASGVMIDFFFPDLIEIGENTIIGMNALLLTHEFLHDRVRIGRLQIGANCLVGARSTVLAGVRIGDGTVISAMSLVHRGTSSGAFVGGVPIQVLPRRHRRMSIEQEQP
jgi:acetyltransferase-like isoleucine patch superfamily enzyme